MGWIIILAIAAIVLFLLYRFGEIGRQALEVAGAAMLIALAGYAWQGSPSAEGSPREPMVGERMEVAPREYIVTDASRMTELEAQFKLTDVLMGMRRPQSAVWFLQGAVKRDPSNPDLWVALGQALYVHGGYQMNTAARYAFVRAEQLNPNHPGPPFFLGMSFAQQGQYAEAAKLWSGMLAKAPADAPWRPDLEARLAEVSRIAAQSSSSPQTADQAPLPLPDDGSSR